MKINTVSDKTADEVFELILNIATSALILLSSSDEQDFQMGKIIALDTDMLAEHFFGDDGARTISKRSGETVLKLFGEDLPDNPPPSMN